MLVPSETTATHSLNLMAVITAQHTHIHACTSLSSHYFLPWPSPELSGFVTHLISGATVCCLFSGETTEWRTRNVPHMIPVDLLGSH